MEVGCRRLGSPSTILVVGASGALGSRFISIATGSANPELKRVILLARTCAGPVLYRTVAAGDIDLGRRETLERWLASGTDAVVYLVGIPADHAREQPRLSRRLHFDGFLRVIRWAARKRGERHLVYASSTAAREGMATLYGSHKRAAERALLAARVSGVALRFPTLLPRPAGASGASTFLGQAVDALGHGLPFTWPVPLERRVLVMSLRAAAECLYAALHLRRAGPFVLDLPATVLSPRALCDAFNAADQYCGVEVDKSVDEAMSRRPIRVPWILAAALGFRLGEPLAAIIERTFELRRRSTQSESYLVPWARGFRAAA